MNQMSVTRERYLRTWAKTIIENSQRGVFTKEEFGCQIAMVNGPRAGALLVSAGIQAGPFMRAMQKDESAVLRQTVSWDFTGDPIAHMQGRHVRLEAGWPVGLSQSMIRLSDLGHCDDMPGRWSVGVSETGSKVIAGLKDNSPHYLVAGATGSGKSVAMRSAALQLARGKNQIVLLDGKYGESLGIASHLHGVIGPVATDTNDIKSALVWVCERMRERYTLISEGRQPEGRIVLMFDEFQEYSGDKAIMGLLSKIAAQGRAANVHAILSTQHPVVDAFGKSSTKRALLGRIALAVSDFDASKVVCGGKSPRADHLLGKGDSYVITPGASHRVQCAYVDKEDFENAQVGEWLFDNWPEYEAESAGQDLPVAKGPTDQELAVAVLSAMAGEGRPALKNRFTDLGLAAPGSGRARRLMTIGKNVWNILQDAPELRNFCKTVSVMTD